MSVGVSHSRVEGYLSCRRKDWYGYQFPTEEGQGIRRIGASDSLSIGTAFHRIAARFYEAVMDGQVDPQDEAWIAYDEVINDDFEDPGGNYASLEEIVNRFLDNEEISQNYEVLAVEKEFNLETDEGEFPFVVDLIIRDPKTGLMYVVDHKTGYYLYDERNIGLMPQIPKYMAALRSLGYNVAGGKYQIIRTQALKGTAMKKDELVEVLQEALGVGPEENWEGKPLAKRTVAYLTELAESKNISTLTPPEPSRLYQVLPVEPNLNRVLETMREQFEVAQILRERDEWDPETQDKRAYRTANQTVCKSCAFRLICEEDLRGGNVNLVLQTEYEPKPKRDHIEVSDDFDEIA